MCGQTKLQGALGTYSFVNPNVSVNYNVTAGTAIIGHASETEFVELGTTLGKISMPYTITNLSVSYNSKNGRTIIRSLPFLEEQINAGNKGKTRKGESAAYFATLPADTDRVTGYLADLAGDDSGSDGFYKFYNVEIQDPESPVSLTIKSNNGNYCNNNPRVPCDSSKYKNGNCQLPYVPCSTSDPTCCVKLQ